MKRLKLFFACLLMAVLSIGQVWAEDVTFTFPSSSDLLGWSADPSPTFESASPARGLAWSKKAMSMTYTLDGYGISHVKVVASTNNAGNYTLSVNGGTGQAVTKDNNKDYDFDVEVADGGTVTISTTYTGSGKSFWIKSIVFTKASSGGTVAVTGVELDEDAITLNEEETQTLTATVSPENASNKNVTWESDDESVATVANGVVTAVGAGDATITCKSVADETKYAECAVHVNASPYTKSTLIFTAACGGTGTADDDAEWAVTSDGAESVYDATSGIHYGTGSANVTYLQLATSDIVGSVAKVVVNARDAQATATISVTVGGTAFTCSEGATATNTSTNYTFTGTGSGEIVVRVDRGSSMSKAIYVKSVVVTYVSDGKEAAGLAFDAAQKLAKVAGTLTAPNLSTADGFDGTVTYASSDEAVVKVNASTGAITEIVAVGKAVITAHSDETENFREGSASYTIFVAEQAGTSEDPLTEASAKALIDLGCTVEAYVKGTVANVGDLNTTYGSITLTLTDGLKFFGMLNTGGTQFETNPFVVEDVVTAVGNLKKYNSTYELDTNCELVERIPAAVVLESISINGTATALEYTDGQHFDPAGLGVVGHYSDASTAPITEGIVWAFDPDPLTEGTESVSVTATAGGKTSAAFVVNDLTVGPAAPLSPWASVYTSNVTLSTEGGTSASDAKVKFYGEEGDGYDAIKAGTGSVQGAVVVNVPAGATALHLHAYGWKGEALTLSITAPAGVTVTPSSITLNSNNGITSNSPFTLTEGSTPQTDAYYALTLSGNTAAADLTFTATSGKRFVLFGVNQVGAVTLESISVSGTATALEYNDGDHFSPAGLGVTGHYSDASTAPITEGIVWAFDPDPLTEGTTSVSVTATASGKTSAAFVVDGLTVAGAAPLSPWASVYTSNVTLSTEGGTSASAAKVKFYGEEGDGYDAIKAGTGSAQGAVVVNVPAGATALHFHAYGWNSESVGLTVTAPTGVTVSPATEISINSNSGIASNSPFTLAEGSDPKTDAYYAVSLSGNTEATNITISATSDKRFVLFGVNQEGGVVPVLKSIAISGDLDKKSYKAGQSLDMTGLEVSATYQLGEETPYNVDITNDAELELTYDPLVENQTSVTITATYKGQTDDITINDLVVTSADPKIYVDPSLTVNFGSVEVGEDVPVNKTITVTLTNVAAATATPGGTNAEAFSIDKTALVEGENVITISVIASTAAAASYSATITITDNAAAATEKVVNLSFAVTEPVVEETPVGTDTKWVAAEAADIKDGAVVLITGVKDEVTYAMGGQNNNNRAAVAGTLNEGVFTPGENTMAFTLVAQGDGTYALRTSNGQYLYAASSSKNYLRTQEDVDDNAKWTLTVSSAAANGTNTNNTMFFNGTNSPKIFSCYASSTTTQLPIQLYVPKQDTPEPPVVDYTEVRNGLTEGWYYTMCLDKAVTAVKAGSIWKVLSKAANGTDVILEEVIGTLDAGRPYIFLAAANTLEVAYTGDAVLTPVNDADNHGLVGSFSQAQITKDDNNYIIYNNMLYLVDSENVYVGANRAYLNMDAVPAYTGAASAPGSRRVVMTVHGEQTATGCENINASETPVKMIIDGQLYILRGEKLFDATGRLVK